MTSVIDKHNNENYDNHKKYKITTTVINY